MLSSDELKILTLAYAEYTGLAISTISLHATGNDKSLGRLLDGQTRSGRPHSITMRSAERASRWFAANWPPTGLAWPEGVRRFKRSSDAVHLSAAT